MLTRLADVAESDPRARAALRAPRLLISGSAALPLREHQRIEALSDRRVLERYGLTETLVNTSQVPGAHHPPSSVGVPLPGVELRLLREDRSVIEVPPLGPSEIGEIAVRGKNVFTGYLHLPEATAQVLDSAGWFRTGDLATLESFPHSSEPVVRIVGRKATDLIKTGGYKVGAGEIESALLEHPKVQEAAVKGLPDPDLGEKIVAYVVLKSGVTAGQELGTSSEELRRTLSQWVAQQLAPHKRPREIHFLSELPRNAMGKIQKGKLSP